MAVTFALTDCSCWLKFVGEKSGLGDCSFRVLGFRAGFAICGIQVSRF